MLKASSWQGQLHKIRKEKDYFEEISFAQLSLSHPFFCMTSASPMLSWYIEYLERAPDGRKGKLKKKREWMLLGI